MLATLSTLALATVLLAAPLPGQFAYVANLYDAKVSVYTIDASTGALTAISGSPFPECDLMFVGGKRASHGPEALEPA